jgi:hypothetical protein
MSQRRTEYYFKHDQNAHADLKIIIMMNKWGVEGYGMFWIILEMLRSSTDYKITDTDNSYSALAYKMRLPEEKVKLFINDCIDKFNLFVRDNGMFYSVSLLERMKRLDEIRDKRAEAGQKGGLAKNEWND